MRIQIQTILISLFVVSSMVLGLYGFLGSMADETAYNINIGNDTSYMNTFSRTEDLQESIEEKYQNIQQNITADRTAQFFTGVADIFILVKDIVVAPFSLIGSLWTDLASVLGFPTWLTGLVIVFVIIIFIFAIVYLVSGKEV